MTPTVEPAGVSRYDICMHSDDVQFLREYPDGDYVQWTDYDALQQQLAEMRAAALVVDGKTFIPIDLPKPERPSPPQDIANGDSRDIVAGLRELEAFLDGSGTIEGIGFGEGKNVNGHGPKYWWRKELLHPVFDRAIAALEKRV